MKSSTRAWLTLMAISTAIIVLGHQLAGREGLLWALVITLSINSLIYFYGDQRIINQLGGRLISGQDPWNISKIVARLSKSTRLPNPTIIVVDHPSPQALAVGRSWQAGTLIFTQGLLESLPEEELEAVVAYMLASIKRQDTLVYAVASAFCGTTLAVTQNLDKILRWLLGSKQNSNSLFSHLFTYLASPLLYGLLRLSVGKSCYYSTDAMAAKFIESPKRMAQVLWKLNSYRITKPFAIPASMAHLFIVNPLTTSGFGRYFQAQPPVENRIRRLLGYFPL